MPWCKSSAKATGKPRIVHLGSNFFKQQVEIKFLVK